MGVGSGRWMRYEGAYGEDTDGEIMGGLLSWGVYRRGGTPAWFGRLGLRFFECLIKRSKG